MSILIPGTNHQITFSIQNITDSTTYYVQAVIRDLISETVLDTINLTDLGNGRFSGSWKVPVDGSGFGREIEVEKTVYEDSAYSTPSGIYGRWLDQYTIFDLGHRLPSAGGYGGKNSGFGSTPIPLDYKEIGRMIKKEVNDAVKIIISEINSVEETENEGTDNEFYSKILNEIHNIQDHISELATRIVDIEDSNRLNNSKYTEMNVSLTKLSDQYEKITSEITSKILAEINNEIKKIIDELDSVKNNLLDDKDYVNSIEKKVSSEMKYILNKLENYFGDVTKKITGELSNSLSKPFLVSLIKDERSDKNDQSNKRSEMIKSLIHE